MSAPDAPKQYMLLSLPSSGSDWFASCIRAANPDLRYFDKEFFNPITNIELGDQLAVYFKVEGGLLVTKVEEGTPAAQAGVKAGDVIVSANGKTVREPADLHDAIADTDEGEELTLGLQRDGRSLELKARLEDRRERVRRRTTIRT